MGKKTYFVVVPFLRDPKNKSLSTGQPVPVTSADAAIRRAASLARTNAGVVAFSRSGDPDFGDFDDPVILAQEGEVNLELLSG